MLRGELTTTSLQHDKQIARFVRFTMQTLH